MKINMVRNNILEKSILEAAEKLFLEKGFDATSTTQIAKAVGCNQALVHYYFRTKDNLFNTIFEQKFRFFFQQIFNVSHLENLPFLEKIGKIIETHFDLINQNPKIPGLIVKELSRQPRQIELLKEKLHTLPEQMFKEFSLELQTEIENGRIRPITLPDLIISI